MIWPNLFLVNRDCLTQGLADMRNTWFYIAAIKFFHPLGCTNKDTGIAPSPSPIQ